MKKYSYFPLPQSYIDILTTREEFILTIVGKDPFPTNPVGIPFCKRTWEEQRKKNSSGLYVLKSLGIDLDKAEKIFTTPNGLFYYLALNGIALLNCSYHYLGAKISKKHYIYIKNALITNQPIISNSKNVILCGQAKILSEEKTEIGIELPNNCIDVVHSDIRVRTNIQPKWQEWWSDDSLKNKYDLDIILPIK